MSNRKAKRELTRSNTYLSNLLKDFFNDCLIYTDEYCYKRLAIKYNVNVPYDISVIKSLIIGHYVANNPETSNTNERIDFKSMLKKDKDNCFKSLINAKYSKVDHEWNNFYHNKNKDKNFSIALKYGRIETALIDSYNSTKGTIKAKLFFVKIIRALKLENRLKLELRNIGLWISFYFQNIKPMNKIFINYFKVNFNQSYKQFEQLFK